MGLIENNRRADKKIENNETKNSVSMFDLNKYVDNVGSDFAIETILN